MKHKTAIRSDRTRKLLRAFRAEHPGLSKRAIIETLLADGMASAERDGDYRQSLADLSR